MLQIQIKMVDIVCYSFMFSTIFLLLFLQQQDLHVVNELMDTSEEQTDERKAERLSSTPRISSMGSITSSSTPPQLADTVLRHNPTTARLLRSLCSRGSGLVRPHIINIQSPNCKYFFYMKI